MSKSLLRSWHYLPQLSGEAQTGFPELWGTLQSTFHFLKKTSFLPALRKQPGRPEGPQPLSFDQGGICSLIHLSVTSRHECACDKDTKIRFILVQEACLWSVHCCRLTQLSTQYGLLMGLNSNTQQAFQQPSDKNLSGISILFTICTWKWG